MMGKGCLLRRRRWISTIFETLLPVLALYVIVLIWQQVGVETEGNSWGPSSTVSEPRYNPTRLSDINSYLSWCQTRGYKLFVTSDGGRYPSEAESLADVFRFYGQVDYQTVSTSITSETDLESYATSGDYANNPYICGAVILKGINVASTWEYSIRMNASLSFQIDYPQQVPSTRTLTQEYSLQNDGETSVYFRYGFLAIQNTVDGWILNTTIPDQDFYPFVYDLQNLDGICTSQSLNTQATSSFQLWRHFSVYSLPWHTYGHSRGL
ncbi:hypothetical protein AAMO2058_000773000 [Amorphochlora amoebiformis]